MGFPGLGLLCLYVRCQIYAPRISHMSSSHISLEWEPWCSLQAQFSAVTRTFLVGCFLPAAQSPDAVPFLWLRRRHWSPSLGCGPCWPYKPWCGILALGSSTPLPRGPNCSSPVSFHSLLGLPHHTDLEVPDLFLQFTKLPWRVGVKDHSKGVSPCYALFFFGQVPCIGSADLTTGWPGESQYTLLTLRAYFKT